MQGNSAWYNSIKFLLTGIYGTSIAPQWDQWERSLFIPKSSWCCISAAQLNTRAMRMFHKSVMRKDRITSSTSSACRLWVSERGGELAGAQLSLPLKLTFGNGRNCPLWLDRRASDTSLHQTMTTHRLHMFTFSGSEERFINILHIIINLSFSLCVNESHRIQT